MIVSVNFPTDEGFWGRKCKTCEKYFKIHVDDLKEKSFCAYCGEQFDNLELNTPEQQKAFDKVQEQVGLSIVEKMLGNMFHQTFRNSKILEYKPGKRTQITPPTEHLEKKVDTEFQCSCGTRFHVFGIFGYCPGCKDENVMIYEENLRIVIEEIEKSTNKQRQLRHAYDDLVSTFEYFGKQYGRTLGMSNNINFQNLKNSRKAFKKYNIDIYDGLDQNEKLVIKKVFLKRHAFQHHHGNTTQDYIREFPEENLVLNQKLKLDEKEFKNAVNILKKLIDKIIKNGI